MRRRSRTRGRQGDHLVIDDRTGFSIWASEAQREWNGGLVHRSVFEARHPQDFVRGVRDDMRVDPARPEPAIADALHAGPFETILALDVAAGDDAFLGVDMSGFSVGDWVRIYLDNGDAFTARIAASGILVDDPDMRVDSAVWLVDGNDYSLSAPLPWPASAGNVVINISNATAADIGPLP